MEKKRFLSPNGLNPQKIKHIHRKITVNEEEKQVKYEEIFKHINNNINNNTFNHNNNYNLNNLDNSSDNNSNSSDSSDNSLNYSMDNLRLTSLENEINYTHNCLISPFKNMDDNMEQYETEESLTEDDFVDDDMEDDYLNFIMDKKKYY
jgi:hypothetical protein